MKPAAILLHVLFLQACSQPTLPSTSTYQNLPSPTTDSAQLADFKRHMEHREAPAPFIPEADTMYCFRGRSGWGSFDYLCSVYNDSTGYKAALTYMINSHSKLTFEEQVKPISPLIWQYVQTEFENQNFWSAPYDPDKSCIDANEYYLWRREGGKFRLVNWNSCEPALDSLRALGKGLRDLCGFPFSTGAVGYSIRRDSIYASIYSTEIDPEIFMKKTEVFYNGKPIVYSWNTELVVPKRDFNKLEKAEIVEYGIDGSVRRFRVSKVYQGKNN